MKEGISATLIAFPLLLGLPALLWAKNDAWEILREITWDRTYTIVGRQEGCTHGQIASLSEHDITLKNVQGGSVDPKEPSTVRIERPDVLRIMDGGGYDIDVVYSGKSSWGDVKAMQHILPDEAVLIVANDGKRRSGKVLQAGDDSLTLKSWNRTTQIRKGDVSQVYYVRTKPLSAGAQYSAQELFLIDPRLWPYLLHIPPKVSVLLYDSSLPEDDAPVRCAPSR